MMGSYIISPPMKSVVAINLIILSLIWCCSSVEGIIGINWGRQTTHRLIPSMVVDLLLQNGVRHLVLFSPSDNVLRAFASSGISLTVTLPNDLIKDMRYPLSASYWLQQKVLKYRNKNVEIRCVFVGTEPFSTYTRKVTYNTAPTALRLIQDSIIANGYKNLTATIPFFTDVLMPNITKPSEADFREDLKERMVEIVHLLNRTNAPFVVNMFPIYTVMSHVDDGWDPEFAFINNKSNFTINDNGLVYHNVFEFVYDCFIHAIAKAGSPGLDLIVGKVGWPTDGFTSANVSNAERFFKEFLPYIRSNKGTPLRPGASINVFIHSLADENKNKVNFAPFQRHWGVYWTSGQPKYKIDFTGQGRDIFPTTAKGLVRMPQRWCVFNGDMSDLEKVREQQTNACLSGDCTTLAPGGSCSHMDFKQNVSYAFNMAFQASAQADVNGVTCNFDGLGKLVPDDPSNGTCKFPVEILAAEKADRDGLTFSGGEINRRSSLSMSSIFIILLSLVLNLIFPGG